MASTSAPASYRRLLGRPGYRGFVLTVSLSRVSATMFNTAGVLLVLVRTHSAALAGLVAMLALAGHAPDWTVPAVAVLYSVTRPFSSGSFASALAKLAGAELLDAASAVEATSLNLAVVIGPVLAGVLSGVIGPAATVEVQVALTLIVALLIAINPAFEARPAVWGTSLRAAVGAGLAVLVRHPVLRATTLSSTAAAFGWGLMLVGFPLYAVRTLHAPAHASGYLWAAVAGGSIIGTFGFRGRPSLARSAAGRRGDRRPAPTAGDADPRARGRQPDGRGGVCMGAGGWAGGRPPELKSHTAGGWLVK